MRTCLVPGGFLLVTHTHTNPSDFFYSWHSDIIQRSYQHSYTLIGFIYNRMETVPKLYNKRWFNIFDVARIAIKCKHKSLWLFLLMTPWHHTKVVLTLLHFDWLYIQSHGNSAKALQQTVIHYIRCCTHSNQMQTIELLKDKHSISSETKPR